MMDALDQLRAKGRVRNGTDDRFYVSVRFRSEAEDAMSPVAPFADPENVEVITQWCRDNCVGAFEPYGNKTIVFTEQEDAILFWLRLR